MNLAELKAFLSEVNLEAIKAPNKLGERNPSGEYMYTFFNLRDFRSAVKALERVSSLSPFISKLKGYDLFDSYSDQYSVESKEHTEISSIMNKLYDSVKAIQSFIDDNLKQYEEVENAIRIKLPPVHDFEKMSKVMNELKMAIAIPIAEETGQQASIDRVEQGSIWFFVILHSKKALQLVGEIAWTAVFILKKKQQNKIFNAEFAEYDLDHSLKENFFNAQEKRLKQLVDSEAVGIHNRINGNEELTNEEKLRLINAIDTMVSLHEEGLEIHPSLNADIRTKRMFPVSTDRNLIESRIKQISAPNDNIEEIDM